MAAAMIVWLYALCGALFGLFWLVIDHDPYANRNDDTWVGWVITILSLSNVVLGVLLVRGLRWARVIVNILTVLWLMIGLYASLISEMPLLFLVPVIPNLVLLVLVNNRPARARFAAKRN